MLGWIAFRLESSIAMISLVRAVFSHTYTDSNLNQYPTDPSAVELDQVVRAVLWMQGHGDGLMTSAEHRCCEPRAFQSQ